HHRGAAVPGHLLGHLLPPLLHRSEDLASARRRDRARRARAGMTLGETTSLCAACKRSVPATLARSGGRVVMRKRCPTHGAQEVEISSNADWYERTLAEGSVHVRPVGAPPVAQGCPFDCGPCAGHEQRVHLPVVPITSACNLDCPICYTHNRNEGAYHMGED